jgi:hypothetical protein
MHQRTDLASGQVTNHDRILIELVQPRSTARRSSPSPGLSRLP